MNPMSKILPPEHEKFQESVSCGYYDSVGGDRKYYTSEMSSLISGLISDGVFSTIGEKFRPSISDDVMNAIKIGTGKCWFNNTWLENTATLILPLPEADPVGHRIDAIVIDIDKSTEVRDSSIWYVCGDAAYDEKDIQYPTLINDSNSQRHQYPICYVRRHVKPADGSCDFSEEDIIPVVGTETPFVHHVVTDVDTCPIPLDVWGKQVEDFVAKERARFEAELAARVSQFDDWYAKETADFGVWRESEKTLFEDWFDEVRELLSSIDVGELVLKVQEDEIKNILTTGLPDGVKSFSDDGSVITATNDTFRLIKTFSSDFLSCTSVLEYKTTLESGETAYSEVATLTKIFNSDGSISSEISII